VCLAGIVKRPDFAALKPDLRGLKALPGAIAAARGGDDDDDDSTGGGGDNNGASETTVEDAGTPVPGGSITYGLEAETNGGYCLPEAQLAISGIQVTRTLYDTLAAPDADGKIQPFLAQSIEPNADYTEWTITIRDGVKFSDGTPLDAQIVADNISAYAGKYPARHPALFIFVFSDLDTVSVKDPKTVVVTTKRPWVAFPWFLWSSARLGIMGRSQLDASSTDCANKLVGTGPFILDHWTVNQELVANKNPNYWMKDTDGNALPYLDSITYKPIAEVAQRVNALESGQIDAMHTSDTEQLAQRLRPDQKKGDIQLLESDKFGETNYTMLNSSKEPFDNKHARLAVAYAMNTPLLIKIRGGGIGTPATGPFAEGVEGYLEDTGFPTYDLDKAKEEVAAYKADTGKDLAFAYTFVTSESGTLTAQEIQTEMDEAGIKMTLNPGGDQATTINKALAHDFQAVGWRNHPGADPDTQQVWWYSTSPVNFGSINDPTMDKLLDDGRTETDPAKRQKIYEDLNKLFASEVYNIWGSWTVWSVAYQPKVHGILGDTMPAGANFPGLGAGHYVTGVWVEQ
jgi:peptide/nickel transport system substrate-binding protein